MGHETDATTTQVQVTVNDPGLSLVSPRIALQEPLRVSEEGPYQEVMACRRKILELVRATIAEPESSLATRSCQQLLCLSSWHACRNISSTTGSGPPAFVFDIDGVLIRGKQVLDPAKRALAKLYSMDGQRPKYPICFLTNGGGVLESEKAEQLSGWLGVNVGTNQVVLSHTPFKELVSRLGDRPVLIAGRQRYAEVAQTYGFTKTVTTAQLAAAHPAAVPFYSAAAPASRSDTLYGSEAAPIEAVLVFNDPSNWYLDLQLMTDVISSGGVLGRSEAPPGSKAVEVYFSNPDLLFANEFPASRFGQGAFAVALRALLTEVAEHPIAHWKVFGKPHAEPYKLVTALLMEQAQQLNMQAPSESGSIYMVGDNPASDIAGARNTGCPWVSVLVRTGVFRGPGPNSTRHPADIVVQDVEEAVDAALHRTRSQRWHSMR